MSAASEPRLPTRTLARLPAAAIERLEGERACWLLLGAAVVVWAALGLWLTRGTTFYSDEYTYFIANRGFAPKAILAPHNGHLIAVIRLIYAAVFKLFGPDYVVFRLLEVFGIALVATLFFVRTRRAVGPFVALVPSVLLLFLGAAAPEVTLSPLGITHLYCIAAGLGALIAIETGTRRGDLAACALLVLSVVTFSFGLLFVAGLAVSVLGREDRWRRSWIWLVPVAVYLLWLAAPKFTGPVYSSTTGFQLSNLLLIPNFAADALAAVGAALTGLGTDFSNSGSVADAVTSPWGYVVAAIAVAALALRLRRGAVPMELWTSLTILVAFWISIAVVAGLNRYPYSQRYVYMGTLGVLLVATDALRGIRLSRVAILGLVAVAILSLGANLSRLRAAGGFLRANGSSLRAALSAIEIAGDHGTPGFFGAPHGLPATPDQRLFLSAAAISTGGGTRPYLAAVRRNGSPAFTLSELRAQPEAVREQADESLINVLGLHLVPAPPLDVGKCLPVADNRAPRDFTIRPPGVVVRAQTSETATLRRFAASAPFPLGTLAAGKFFALRIPADGAPDPWHLVLPAGALTVCELGSG